MPHQPKFRRRFVNGLFVIGIFLLTCMGYLTYKQIQRINNANYWVSHTYQVIDAANELIINSLLIDSSLQSSHFPAHKDLLNELLLSTNKNVSQIRFLTRDNIHQQNRMIQLERVIRERNNLIATLQTSPNEISIEALKIKSLQMKGIIKIMKEEEYYLLKIRDIASNHNMKIFNSMFIFLIFFGELILILTFVLINYQLRQLEISEQKEHELKNQYTRIINGTKDLIASLDVNFNFLVFNDAYEKKFFDNFGLRIKPGMNFKQLLIDNSLITKTLPLWKKALKGEEFIITISFDEKGLGERYYEITFNPIRDENGEMIAAAHIMRDVTTRMKLEHLKAEFVSIVSHELRTPLTSIRGSLTLVLSESLGKLNESIQKLLNIASNNCDRLTLLINDLLDIDKLEKGKSQFNFKVTGINRVVEEAVLANLPYGEKYSVKFILEKLPKDVTVNIDSQRLRQVLDNFISNAIKFSKPQDTIDVIISQEEKSVRVAVIDRGEGVPLEFHDLIFQKFAQADSSDTRKRGGTGLGLSISKVIVEMHNGKIGFTSEPHKQTIFYFTIPLAN